MSIVWNTPFSSRSFPGVRVIPSQENEVELDVIVYEGVHGYPAYIISFKHAVTFRNSCEGMIFKSFQFSSNQNSCCYIVQNSPWIEEFKESKEYIEGSFGEPFDNLKHFVIIGGDNVIEVISLEPTIEAVEEKRLFKEIWI